MKYLFNFLLIAATLSAGTILISCGDDVDEPQEIRTQAPKIIEDVSENHVFIQAVGEGEVKLYRIDVSGMQEVENPQKINRYFWEQSRMYAATAKGIGKLVSDTIVKTVNIPKTYAPQTIRVYSIIDNKNDSTNFVFNFNPFKEFGTILVRKAVFDNSGDNSQKMNFTFGSQVIYDQDACTYYCSGTYLTTTFSSDGQEYTIEGSTMTNLNCEVCIKDLTYKLTFDCHGKHFDYSGKVTEAIIITVTV